MNTSLKNTRNFSILSIVFIACYINTYAFAGELQINSGRSNPLSIEPYSGTFVVDSKDRRQPYSCLSLKDGRKCAPIIKNPGLIFFPLIEPAFTAKMPNNLQVVFSVDEITHEITSNGGVGSGFSTEAIVDWENTILGEDVVPNPGTQSQPLPDPGETDTSIYQVYNGLLLDGCSNFQTLDINHSATVSTDIELGNYNGHDNSTIDSTGYYIFNYTVNAVDGDKESSFHFKGKISVLCTASNTL